MPTGPWRKHAPSGITVWRLAAVALVVLELLSFLPAGGHPFGARSSPVQNLASVRVGSLDATGAAQIQAAENSLASGAGPAGGGVWSCSPGLAPSGGAKCGAAPAANPVHPLTSTLPSWSLVKAAIPPLRQDASMTYDARDKYVLLFGGRGGVGYLTDTWSYGGGVWTHLHPATSPPTRSNAAMTFDAADNYVVLYGGANSTLLRVDTWKFAGGLWTPLTPTTHPGRSVGGSMCYDAKDGYAVYFGGTNTTGGVGNETWKFKAGQWSLLAPHPAPPARWYAMFAYDAKDGYAVLFGGSNSLGSTPVGDTWNFTAGHWTNITPVKSPSPRLAGGLAYSAKDAKLVLFGGVGGSSTFFADTWTFVGGIWTKIGTSLRPSARGSFEMADGTVGTNVVLFGGVPHFGISDLNDTWTFHGIVWAKVAPPTPVGREAASMTYDEADGYVLLFGGASATYLGDTWKFVHGTWTNLHPSVAPAARDFAGMAFDSSDGYVVLFGGVNGSGYLSDTWTYLAGVWTPLLIPAPSARGGAGVAYDAADGYVLLFGGVGTGGTLGDTWSFSAGVWTNVGPASGPAPRYLTEMSYDSADGFVVLFSGGQTYPNSYPDTWTYLAGTWRNETGRGNATPPGTVEGGLVDDTYDGYVVLYGGYTWPGGSLNQTWAFVNLVWTQQFPARNPGTTVGPAAAFDPSDNSVIFFGGAAGSVALATTWSY
jgi:galactose oxidase-like protein